MKKLVLVVLSAFCLGACSVDAIEMEPADSQLLVLDATFEVNGCYYTTFSFGDAGELEMRNDRDFIYVKITAKGNFEIKQSNLHFATDLAGFPLRGKNLRDADMAYKLPFDPGVKEYTWTFPINSFGDSFLVAAYTVFKSGNKDHKLWAGDLSINNTWSYFQYDLNEHPYNTGADKSREITVSEAAAAESWDEVRKLFSNMLDPGVPRHWRDGHYEPSIDELIKMFHDPYKDMIGEYTTIYTLGAGDCKDSVKLTVIVVPDPI